MTQPNVRKCANTDCGNTWEVPTDADVEHEVCGPCEMEAQTQPNSAESECGWGSPEATHPTPKEFSEKLGQILKRRVVTLGIQATLMAATLDPRLHPDADDKGKAPDGISPEVLGAARDMADYLGGSQAPPESNRNNIPHARAWDLGHAVHVMRDVAYAIEKFPGEMSPAAQKRGLLDLLDLTWDAALVSQEEGSLPLLNLMVEGRAGPDILPE